MVAVLFTELEVREEWVTSGDGDVIMNNLTARVKIIHLHASCGDMKLLLNTTVIPKVQ